MKTPSTSSGPRRAALGVLALALAAGAQARATIYTEWQPRLTLGAGFDDNILLDGRGGDPYGQVLPGLKLFLFGPHGLRGNFDCQVGFSRLAHPDQFQAAGGDLVFNQLCNIDVRDRLGPRTSLHVRARTGYSQDPFSISNLGLLLRAGQRNIFSTRLNGELAYRTALEDTVTFGVAEESLFFKSGDVGNGLLVMPNATWERRTSPYDAFSLGVREQLFFGLGGSATPTPWAMGTTGFGTAALGGWKRKLSHTMELRLQAGPSIVTEPGSSHFMPIARLDLEAATPTTGLHFAVAHDTVLGPTKGGPLVGDLAEAGLSGTLLADQSGHSLAGHLRGGIYRNQLLGADGVGILGYSAGVGLDWKFSRAWTVGASVGRDARLFGDAVDYTVDRDIFQFHLTWETPRTW